MMYNIYKHVKLYFALFILQLIDSILNHLVEVVIFEATSGKAKSEYEALKIDAKSNQSFLCGSHLTSNYPSILQSGCNLVGFNFFEGTVKKKKRLYLQNSSSSRLPSPLESNCLKIASALKIDTCHSIVISICKESE